MSTKLLPKCKAFCEMFPCTYGDNDGCMTSDPSGEYCKRIAAERGGEQPTQTCKGADLRYAMLHLVTSTTIDEPILPMQE